MLVAAVERLVGLGLVPQVLVVLVVAGLEQPVVLRELLEQLILGVAVVVVATPLATAVMAVQVS